MPYDSLIGDPDNTGYESISVVYMCSNCDNEHVQVFNKVRNGEIEGMVEALSADLISHVLATYPESLNVYATTRDGKIRNATKDVVEAYRFAAMLESLVDNLFKMEGDNE